MKISEVVEKIAERPYKEFFGEHEGLRIEICCVNDNIEYSVERLDGDDYNTYVGLPPIYIANRVDWKPLPRKVDFMTAFYAWSEENKTIKCVHTSTEVFEGGNNQGNFGAGQIRLGEWYVIEEGRDEN